MVLHHLGQITPKSYNFRSDLVKVVHCCATKHLSCNIQSFLIAAGDLVAQGCEAMPPSPN